MSEAIPLTRPSARPQVIAGVALGGAALATLLVGREAVSAFLAALVVAAYVDLRRLLGPWGHIVTTILGAGGVVAFLWSGYGGRLDLVPAAGAALVLALLASRVLLHEASGNVEGTTADVASTLGAAAVVGVFGAHILLIRSLPRNGFRALLAFAAMVLAADVAAFVVGRWRGRHRMAPNLSAAKTWEGALAGLVASVIAGGVCGVVLDPPFDPRSGLALGAATGVLAILGDLVFSVVKRGETARGAAVPNYLGPLGGALDVLDGLLFAAPAFYWALRTLAL